MDKTIFYDKVTQSSIGNLAPYAVGAVLNKPFFKLEKLIFILENNGYNIVVPVSPYYGAEFKAPSYLIPGVTYTMANFMGIPADEIENISIRLYLEGLNAKPKSLECNFDDETITMMLPNLGFILGDSNIGILVMTITLVSGE